MIAERAAAFIRSPGAIMSTEVIMEGPGPEVESSEGVAVA